MKIERLLAITVVLLNQRKVTAKELAEHFEVSLKTIYRDFETLNMAGIPVISYQGYEGGFCIPDNFKLSRQLLTYDEMVSILTSLKGINNTLNNKEVSRIIEKITALIPADKKEIYKQHGESFIIDISPWGGPPQQKSRMQHVHKAISTSTLLQFHYTAAQGIESQRIVEPHTLAFKHFNWYILAYCRLRKDFRIFRLSRMRNLMSLPDRFTRRNCDPLIYFHGEMDSRPTTEVILKFSARVKVRVEEIFDEEHLQYNKDGSITATFHLPEDEWISSFVLSFADEVELLSPPEWRKNIQKKITRIHGMYTNWT